jgi:hypothetical protein
VAGASQRADRLIHRRLDREAERSRRSRATEYAEAVIRDNTALDGTELSPMRIAECRITLGFVAGRRGDLEQAVDRGREGLKDGRQSKVQLRMIAAELNRELHQRFPGESHIADFEDALHSV